MFQHLIFCLLVFYIGTYTSANSTNGCAEERGNLCRSSAEFQSWEAARDHCTSLGRQLAIPEPKSTDTIKSLIPENGKAWIGGRSTRVLTGNNPDFFHAAWKGCVENIETKVDFFPSSSLSECLKFCYTFKYAYVKRDQCGCSHDSFTSVANSGRCVDPYNWVLHDMPSDNIHQFLVPPKVWYGSAFSCGFIQVDRNVTDYSLHLDMMPCESEEERYQYQGLCQSFKIPQRNNYIKYGESYLWRLDLKSHWISAEQLCKKEDGNLVKLEWDSPLLNRELYHYYQNSRMWIGLGRIRWRFIDDRYVNDVWPRFGSLRINGCLIWRRFMEFGLEGVACSQSSAIPAICSLFTDPPVDNVSDPPLDLTTSKDPSHANSAVVGIVVGLNLAVILVAIVALVLMRR